MCGFCNDYLSYPLRVMNAITSCHQTEGVLWLEFHFQMYFVWLNVWLLQWLSVVSITCHQCDYIKSSNMSTIMSMDIQGYDHYTHPSYPWICAHYMDPVSLDIRWLQGNPGIPSLRRIPGYTIITWISRDTIITGIHVTIVYPGIRYPGIPSLHVDAYGINTMNSYPYNGYDRYGVATISRLLMIGLFCKRAI